MKKHLSFLKRSREGFAQLKFKWIITLSTLFIALNIFFIAKDFYWFLFVPIVFLIIILAFAVPDSLLFIIVFLVPFSITFHDYDFGVGLTLPTEPLLFGVMIIYIMHLLYEKKIDRKVFFHPITITILINLLWIFLTSITSTLPLVSWKFFLSRLWFVIPFYFVALHLFRNKSIGDKDATAIDKQQTTNLVLHKRFIWLYLISFTVIIIYTLANHSMKMFSEEAAHVSMLPFYNDHTSYGAMLAMFFPVLLLFCFDKDFSYQVRYFAFLILLLYTIGLIFSYTRAAWISMAVAIGAFVVYLLRLHIITILIFFAICITFLSFYQQDIMIGLEANRYKQMRNRNIEHHFKSITNITTDPSNTERLNRWYSAFRMFKEKPFFGWGPGTYQFQYAPFQISAEKTIISTNSGEFGNAHSEYIGPLSESGIFGILTILAIVITTLFTSGRLIYRTRDKRVRLFAIALSVGLITYFVHGTLNNFLDTDKASAPFWGFIAMIVAMDISDKSSDTIKNVCVTELTIP
ncbi:MAG: O-antigen ligase family protein [Bacteroidota bacterium]